MNYYDDNLIWKDIIETISRELKRNNLMIEKDVIQSKFLYNLSKYDFPFVFKGGTSLSKAYGLIDRFSEDIDLSVDRKITDKEKKKSKEIILEVANNLGLTPINLDNVLSRHDYNKYIFSYNSLFSDEPMEIIVETSYFMEVYPVVLKEVNSYVYSFAKDNNITIPVDFVEGSFKMKVQSLERTFIDKVFAICDYRICNMMDRDSRHLYDIAKMYPKINFNDNLKELINKVRLDRSKSKNNPSADFKYDINKMLEEIISSNFYESDYRNITEKLLYEKYPYEKSLKEGIEKVIELNIF